jgi:RecA-family ATPase
MPDDGRGWLDSVAGLAMVAARNGHSSAAIHDAVTRAVPSPIESGAKPFEVIALAVTPTEARPAVVQRLIESSTVIAIVGAPNGGKTALAIDLAEHIAAGVTWFGLKVAGGPVIYIAAEAPGSVTMRAKAAAERKFAGRRLPFYLVVEAPLLGGEVTSLIDTERVIATVRRVESLEGEKIKFLVVDTLASALGDGDENGDGMLRLVAAAKWIALQTGAAVAVVHHPSKGDAAGLRGHGSLAAACDAIFVIAVDEFTGQRTATLTKSRDSATGLQIAYELEQVALPDSDAFGDPRTTIIVKQTAAPKQRRPRPSGKRQQTLLDDLERRYRTGETGWDEATLRKAGRELGMADQSARDAVRGLIQAGYLAGQPAHLTLKFPPDALL